MLSTRWQRTPCKLSSLHEEFRKAELISLWIDAAIGCLAIFFSFATSPIWMSVTWGVLFIASIRRRTYLLGKILFEGEIFNDQFRKLQAYEGATWLAGSAWGLVPLLLDNTIVDGGPALCAASAAVAGASLATPLSGFKARAFPVPIALGYAFRSGLDGNFDVAAAVGAFTCIYWGLTSVTPKYNTFLKAAGDERDEALEKWKRARVSEAILKQAPFGMLCISEDFCFAGANSAFYSMIGNSPNEIKHENIIENLAHEEDAPSVREASMRLLRGESEKEEMEVRYVRTDGKVFWAYSEISLVVDVGAAAKFIVVQFHDIDARKGEETALKRAVRQKNLAVQAVGLGECVVRFKISPDEDRLDLREIEFNDMLCDILGVSRNEFDCSLSGLIKATHPDDRKFVRRELADVFFSNSKEALIESRIVRPGGEVRHIRTAFAVYCDAEEQCRVRVGVVMDITEQVNATKTLEDALSRSELSATVAGLGVSQYDPKADVYVWDERMIEIYGVDAHEYDFTRESQIQLIHPEDRSKVVAEETTAIRNRQTRCSIEHRICRPNGEVRHIKATWINKFSAEGVFEGAVATVLDVTQYTEMVNALKQERDKLKQSLEERRLAINLAGLGEYRCDLVSGQCEWNYQLYEIFGVNPDTFNSDKEAFLDLVYPEDRPRVSEWLYVDLARFEGAKREAKAITFRIMRPSGEVRFLSAHAHVVRDKGAEAGGTFFGLVRDETDETCLREALLKEKTELHSALTRAKLAIDLAGLGVFEFDKKLEVNSWDERLCEIYGVDAAAANAMSQYWLGMVHPDDRDYVIDELRKAGLKREPFQMNFRILRPTGEIRYLRVSSMISYGDTGAMLRALAVTWDVTDRVRLLEEVERDRRLLDATLKAISDAVIRTDQHGKIEYMNPAAWRIAVSSAPGASSGVQFESRFMLFSRTTDEVSESVEAALDWKQISGAEISKGDMHNIAAELRVGEDRARHVELAVEALYGPSSACVGYVIVLHDVTELKESEKALAESRSLFRTALDHASVGLSVLGKDGRFSFVNKELSRIAGRLEADMLGESAAALLIEPPEGISEGDEEGLHCDNDGLVYENIISRPPGEDLLARISFRRVFSDHGVHVCTVAQVQDVTEENRRLEELHEAKEMAQITLASASEGIVRTDREGVITLCNPTAAALIGKNQRTLSGRLFSDVYRFFAGMDNAKADDLVAAVVNSGEAMRIHSTLKLLDGNNELRRVNVSIAPMNGEDGAVMGVVVLIQDASEIAKLTERLTRQAYTDDLTGIGNRRAFEERTAKCIDQAGREKKQDYIILIDLDHFKVVNDACGHGVGDDLICDVSQIFQAQVRESDFVARVGGDEFGIILRSANEDSAAKTAQKIIDSISAYRLVYNNEAFHIGASIGITTVVPDMDVSSLMSEADTACYTAKNMGRGRYCFYHANDMAIAEAREDQNWFHRITHAIETGRFKVFFQEIVDKNRQVVGFEALLRLSENNMIFGPGAFIETARRHGMVPKFDRFMLEEVLQFLRDERRSGLEGKYISINLSASSVADPMFRSWVEEMLEAHQSQASMLWLELTESDRMRWSEAEIEFLASVRSKGVRLYFDDFGTGYNSFDVLKRVDVDGLKLDHSVIRNIMTSPIDQALVLASLNIARNLDIDLVAEGVEDERTLDFLASLGVKKFQGYLFHKPEGAASAMKRGGMHRRSAG